MEVNNNALRMSELRALMRERGLWGYYKLRKDGLTAFLWDNVWMETNYNALRLVELRVLMREHGLQGYYRLKKAELIALLRNNKHAPMPLPLVRPRPPKPMRPPPHSWRFVHSIQIGASFQGLIGVSESMEEAGWMWKPSLERPKGVLLTWLPRNFTIWMWWRHKRLLGFNSR